MRRQRPKFKVSFYLYFCCFWINVTQINFENIKRKIQRIIYDSCFQSKSWFNVDARAPSIPLLNFPFKLIPVMDKDLCCFIILNETLTKINAKRRNWYRCHVFSDCDRRIRIVIDDNVGHYAEMNYQIQNWKEYDLIWHTSSFTGRNWSKIFIRLNEEVWKLTENLYYLFPYCGLSHLFSYHNKNYSEHFKLRGSNIVYHTEVSVLVNDYWLIASKIVFVRAKSSHYKYGNNDYF